MFHSGQRGAFSLIHSFNPLKKGDNCYGVMCFEIHLAFHCNSKMVSWKKRGQHIACLKHT